MNARGSGFLLLAYSNFLLPWGIKGSKWIPCHVRLCCSFCNGGVGRRVPHTNPPMARFFAQPCMTPCMAPCITPCMARCMTTMTPCITPCITTVRAGLFPLFPSCHAWSHLPQILGHHAWCYAWWLTPKKSPGTPPKFHLAARQHRATSFHSSTNLNITSGSRLISMRFQALKSHWNQLNHWTLNYPSLFCFEIRYEDPLWIFQFLFLFPVNSFFLFRHIYFPFLHKHMVLRFCYWWLLLSDCSSTMAKDIITDNSTSDDVRAYLVSKGFSSTIQNAFQHWDGEAILAIISLDDLPTCDFGANEDKIRTVSSSRFS